MLVIQIWITQGMCLTGNICLGGDICLLENTSYVTPGASAGGYLI